MKTQKYAVNQYLIESILAKVREGEIAIPEIQRPFVWDATQARDLLDSLYQGFPVGYLIAWRNPDVRLKDGSLSAGKMILIDGQQRVTALTAAILGQPVVNKDYRKVRITIAWAPWAPCGPRRAFRLGPWRRTSAPCPGQSPRTARGRCGSTPACVPAMRAG